MENYLLDTHVILWFLEGKKQLPIQLQNFIIEKKDKVIVSSVSLWEISIKLNINKLPTKLKINDFIEKSVQFWKIKSNLTMLDIITYQSLPLHHRDPFDRMLIAQAKTKNMIIITKDSNFSKYDIDILW